MDRSAQPMDVLASDGNQNDEPLPALRSLGDARFCSVMGVAAWQRLHPSVRKRFSRRAPTDQSIVYRGRVTTLTLSRLGHCLSWLGRLVGNPLPLNVRQGSEAVVLVKESASRDCQAWTRIYARENGLPQVIQSEKRFLKSGKFEECVANRLGLSLSVRENNSAIMFVSNHYYVRFFGLCIPVPALLSPGQLEISHRHVDSEHFEFELRLQHPWFGQLIQQKILFHELAK